MGSRQRNVVDRELCDTLDGMVGLDIGLLLYIIDPLKMKLLWQLSLYSEETIREGHYRRFPEHYQRTLPPPQQSYGHPVPNVQTRYPSGGMDSTASRPPSDTFSQPSNPRSSAGTEYSIQLFNQYNHRESLASIDEHPNTQTYNSQPHSLALNPTPYDNSQPADMYFQVQTQAPPSYRAQPTTFRGDISAPAWPLPNVGPLQSSQDQTLALSQHPYQGIIANLDQARPTDASPLPEVDVATEPTSFPDSSYTQSPAAMFPMIQHHPDDMIHFGNISQANRKRRAVVIRKQKPCFCPYTDCSKEFVGKTELKKHIQADHERTQTFNCKHPSCNRTFYRESEWKGHHSTGHGKCNEQDPTKCREHILDKSKQFWGCNLCPNLSTSLEDSVKHFEYHVTHDKKSAFDCDYSLMMQNLLRQDAVREAWEEQCNKATGSFSGSSSYKWDPRTSSGLLHDLERGLHQGVSLALPGKADDVVEEAVSLSKGKHPATSLPDTFQSMMDLALNQSVNTPWSGSVDEAIDNI